MKILKLAAIFIVIVGGIFLAMNWGALFPSSSSEENFVEEDLVDISEKCDEIRKAWAAQTGWDEELYKLQREDIDQSKAMGMFSREGYNTVNNCLRESATNKACAGYMSALKEGTFSDAVLQKAYKGVVTIKNYEKLDKEPRITQIEQLHQLYTGISNFVKSSHTISPRFDTTTTDWTSFASLQNGILAKARSYRGNKLFKELEHIPGFKSGLSEDQLKAQTNPQRKGFYQQLSTQIINYFSTQDPTPDKVNLLNQIYKNFAYQETNYGLTELATFKVNYGSTD